MEIRDGFIVGIYNYCDRWCEACAFTSRCRAFAVDAQFEAASDPSMKALVDAPVLPEDEAPDPPEWLQKIIEEAATLAELEDTHDHTLPILPAAHQRLNDSAHAYGRRCHKWLQDWQGRSSMDPADPLAVIGWFSHFIPAKVYRALMGLAEDDPDERDWPTDHDGSAKIALIAIERSRAAWLSLVERGQTNAQAAEPFVSALLSMEADVERIFPNARAFVRPGFDEPEAVAELEIQERH